MNQNSRNLIFYSAHTQFDNLGDLLINKILLSYLRQYGKLIVDDRKVPESYLKNLGVEPHEKISQFTLKPNYLMVWLRLKNLLSSQPNKPTIYHVVPPGHRYGKASFFQVFSSVKILLLAAILKLSGVRTCQFGVSIGPYTKILRIKEFLYSKLTYFYSVRDTLSKEYAHKIGIEKVNIFPDLAWFMEIDPQKYLNEDRQKNDYILFSFRASTHALAPLDNYQEQLFKSLDRIVEIARDKWSKRLVVSYQVESDYEFCKTIAQRYKDSIDLTFIEHIIDESLMYDLYSGAYMIISNRLHVLLFGMNCGSLPVPVVDTKHHDKITGIFHDAGLDELLIDIVQDSGEGKKIIEISENIESWKQKIDDTRKRQQDVGKQLFDEVFTYQ